MKSFKEFLTEAEREAPAEFQKIADETVKVINKYLPKVKYDKYKGTGFASNSHMWEISSRKPPKYNDKLMALFEKEGYETAGVKTGGMETIAYTPDGNWKIKFGLSKGKQMEISKA